MRHALRAAVFGLLLLSAGSAAAAPIQVTLFKDPQCGCCGAYAEYLRANGFDVEVKETDRVAAISREAGVPEQYTGCHTSFVEGYVVDGHVPVAAIQKLLAERPAIAGIAVPGMPLGSPGMGGDKTEPLTVYAVTKDGAEPTVYAVE